MIYEFKISLHDVGVPVWRTIQIDSSSTFRDLHNVLQVAFDWENMHLHSFFVETSNGSQIDIVEIGLPKPDDVFQSSRESLNEDEVFLAGWFKEVNDSVRYVYDFGDDWTHEITLMKKIQSNEIDTYPWCTDAKNNAPEEDSRAEVIMEKVNLKNNNSQNLIKEINNELMGINRDPMESDELSEVVNEFVKDADDPWQDLLLQSKEFYKLKPWEFMDDNQIFAVIDPATEEWLFCSVLGSAGEVYGLAVYQGKQGYDALIDVLDGALPDFDFILKQRSLLMSFEDRLDLEKEDYDLIKAYDVPFRGKKAWPEFRSFKPGFVPWFMDDDDGWTLSEVLEQVLELCEEMQNGLELPDIYSEEKVLARVPKVSKDDIKFVNEILPLKSYNEQATVSLEVSELDLKRVQKITNQVLVTVEFSIAHLDMPVQDDLGGRPAFPALVVAVEHERGVAFFQDLLYDSTDIELLQNQLIKILQLTEGIPEKILMDKKTAALMEPLINELEVNVEVIENLPNVQEIINGIEESM